MQTIKIVVLGDGEVGKTALLKSYTGEKFPTEYVPTEFQNYTITITAGGEPYTWSYTCNLDIFDTYSGEEDYYTTRGH